MRSSILVSSTVSETKKPVWLICMVFFAVFFSGALASQETVRQRFESVDRNSEIEDVVYLTVGAELANAGYSTVKTEEGTAYELLIEYTKIGNEFDFTFSIFRTGDTVHPLAEVSTFLSVDYTLDAEIAKLMRLLLEKAGIEALPALNMEIEGLFAPDEILGLEVPKEEEPDEEAPALEILEPTVTSEPDAVEPVTGSPFVTSAGFGGIVFFGEMTDFFAGGITGMLQFGLQIPKKERLITPGARISATRVLNEKGIEGGELYISTLGFDIQYGTGNGKPFRVSAAASLGAAIITLVHKKETLNKTVPFADSGVYARMSVDKGISIGLDIRFLCVFDPDMLIMGAVPLIFVDKEL